jgi:monoamine oxidase
MQRRNFLKTALLSTAGTAIIGCNKNTDPSPDGQPAYSGNVAIIGAGMAGLYAGYLLKEKNVKFTIFEASDRVGGRVRSLKGFADFDIDLGGDEVIGKKSTWYDWVKSTNASFLTEPTTDYYQISGVLRPEELWKTDTDFMTALQLIDGANNYGGADLSLQQYMDNNRLSGRVQHILAARIANKKGTSSSRISVKGVTEESQLSSAGKEVSLVTNRSLYSILEEKFKDIIPQVALNTVISRIDYSGIADQGIIIEDSKAQKKIFDKVIITVPLAILQAGDLKFTPELPKIKTDALNKIGIGAGMTIALQFSKPFWLPGTGSIYSQGTVVPEFRVASNGRSKEGAILTAQVMGSRAEALARLGANAVNQIALELDAMYGRGNASGVLKNANILDWAKEPFIKGAYSYPVVGGGVVMRQELSRAIQRKLYFAGEATHYGGHNGTVHGAMETAQRSVNELLQDVV